MELNHFFSGNMKGMSDRMAATCVEFVDAFIDFGPGLLVAAVHGPAAGISVSCWARGEANKIYNHNLEF